LAIENARLRQQFFEYRDRSRRGIEGFAECPPFGGSHDDVYVLREYLLGGLVGVLQHEIAEACLPQFRGTGKHGLLGWT
jgi:hypothetical protein